MKCIKTLEKFKTDSSEKINKEEDEDVTVVSTTEEEEKQEIISDSTKKKKHQVTYLIESVRFDIC